VVLPSLFEEELAEDPGRVGADPRPASPIRPATAPVRPALTATAA
jgi:hypothetical protein